MRKIFIIIALVLFAASASAQDSLKIISPNGGEKFLTGSDTVITWRGIPLTDTVKLEYSTDAGSSWNFITDTATGGRYSWHIPKTVSDSCLVRVEEDPGSKWIKQISRKFPGPNLRSYDDISSIAVDSLGNIYATGLFQDTIDFGGVTLADTLWGYNFFIAKYHKDGSIEWANKASGVYTVNGIAVDLSGNIYVTGSFLTTADFGGIKVKDTGSDAMFIAKYHSNGVIEWVKTATEGTVFPEGICVDNFGNIYAVGFFAKYIDFHSTTLTSSANNAMYIVKYHQDGTVNWAIKGDGSDVCFGYGVTIDHNENIYINGDFRGDTLILDTITLIGNATDQLFLAKYNPTGKVVWATNNIGGGTAIDASNNIHVTHSYSKGFGGGMFITKYRPDRSIEWTNNVLSSSVSGYSSISGYDIIVDRNDNTYIIGVFEGIADFGSMKLTSAKDSSQGDIFIVKYYPDGNLAWAKRTGGQGHDRGRAIAGDAFGNIYAAGSFDSTSDFGDTIFEPKGINDIFLWKIESGVSPFDISDSLFSIIKPKTLLSISNDSGYAGDHKNIPLLLKNAPISSVQSLATKFSARIAYDRTVLYPTTGSIQHGARFDTVTFTGAISSDSAASGTLALLPFVAMLGESTFSPMKIVDFTWLDGTGLPADIDVATDSGTFYLLGICPAGGTRLYNPDGQVSMAHVNPNPANGIIHIEIQTTETGRTQLYLMNLLGQRVATISDDELKPGVHTFDFNSNQLSAGSYFLTLTTPTVRRIERVDVEK